MHEHLGGFDTPSHRTVQLRLRVLVREPPPHAKSTRGCRGRGERERGGSRGRRRRGSAKQSSRPVAHPSQGRKAGPTTWEPLPLPWISQPLLRSFFFPWTVPDIRPGSSVGLFPEAHPRSFPRALTRGVNRNHLLTFNPYPCSYKEPIHHRPG